MYDYIIVTHIPVFYKVNLYNELSKKLNILVVFISSNTNEKRTDDFIIIEEINFDYEILERGDFQVRNKYENIKKLGIILKKVNYKNVIVSGWDLVEFWYLIFTNSKYTNCLALESTILESNTHGIKGIIKKLFLSRVSVVFASGKLHVELLKALKYKKEILVTKGVGIINKPKFLIKDKIYQKNFLYIGRLSKVKNLELLINVFNDLSEYRLSIIGIGEEEEYLKSIANMNIVFKGSVENKKIKDCFLKNDIFILPSLNEPWGLVVEESLYFGLPVMISQNCGSVELIEDSVNGYVFNPNDKQSIKDTILKIDARKYKELCAGVEKVSIDKKDKIQVSTYL